MAHNSDFSKSGMRKHTFNPLVFLRRCARLSVLARVLWLAVALLHAYLIMRRIAVGEWAGLLDWLRATLCLAGVGYASLKFWQVATVLDSAPRRVLAFGLILMLGHWMLAVPDQENALLSPTTAAGATAVLSIVPSLGVALLLLRATAESRAWRPRRVVITASYPTDFEFSYHPLARLRHAPFLFSRPPPHCS